MSRMWESVPTKKCLYKAAFTNLPAVLNLYTNMYLCICLPIKKKKKQLAMLPKRNFFLSLPYLRRETIILFNMYLSNSLHILTMSHPGHILMDRRRNEHDHDLTSYTPLILQLNQLIWFLTFSLPIP